MRHKLLSTTGSTRGTAYTMSNKILTHEDKTHVVWLDQIHKTYVRTYNHKARRWSAPVFVSDGDDNHAGAAFAMDSQGHLHLVFGPHHNPIQYAVSAKPNSTTKWRRQPSLRVRSLLMQDVENLMEQWDVIATPVEDYGSLAVMNLTGHPEVVVPSGSWKGCQEE